MDVMVYSFVLPVLILLWHLSKGSGRDGSAPPPWCSPPSAAGWPGSRPTASGASASCNSPSSGSPSSPSSAALRRTSHSSSSSAVFKGLGFGGEWAVGSVLIGEAIRARYRGRAVGTVQSGWALGWGLAAIFSVLFFKLFSPDIAWRAMFWIGLAPAALAIYVRKHVPEPQVYSESAASHGQPAPLQLPAHLLARHAAHHRCSPPWSRSERREATTPSTPGSHNTSASAVSPSPAPAATCWWSSPAPSPATSSART